MGLFNKIHNKKNKPAPQPELNYEYCPRCDANLTLQKGYSNDLPFWNCKGCGEMLINPNVEAADDIVWICDGCGCMLNIQEGFSNDCEAWICKECGFLNEIDESEVYTSEEEFQDSLHDPYKGLSDTEIRQILSYEEIKSINNHKDVFLVKDSANNQLFIKKYLEQYDFSVYKYLKKNPVKHMPQLISVFEGLNNLVVIEEYIEGKTLTEVLKNGNIPQDRAIEITKSICEILSELHNGDRPIIHRDVKPSNIIITEEGTVFLLDINIAKWYKPEEIEDTKLSGTMYFAAPEQFGFGFFASSVKSDIYAVGVLLNVMLTGKLPKEERAKGAVWKIIEKCISLDSDNRYTAEELILALKGV